MNQARKRTGTKKVLSMILVLVMLLSLLSMAAFTLPASETGNSKDAYEYNIMFLDCGRKYFSVDSIEKIIDNASAAGFNYIQLAVGNDGLRFLLDDMSLTVDKKTYDSETVKSAIHAGNEAYYNFDVDELTQSEMDTIIAYAGSKGMGVIPCVNSPGHMDAILSAATSLTGKTCSYNGSARTIDVTNTTAVAFTKAVLQKYINYFAGKGCQLFNMGADEYANDIYTTGSMGFGNLQSTGKYSSYVKYVNAVDDMIQAAGMTAMAFNDGIYFNSNTSSGKFNTDIIICYWSNGWNGGYTPMPASDLASKGFKLINTHGDYYWVLGKSDWQCSKTKASGFNYKQFQGSEISNPAGSMFCIWSDYPGAETEASVISKTADTIAAFGKTLPTVKKVETVESKTVTKGEVTVTAPGLTDLTVTATAAPTIDTAAEGKVSAYDVTPATENGSYAGRGSVSLPVPKGWDASRVRGYIVNDDSSVTTGLTGTIAGDKFTFTVPHFSKMGIYELAANAATETKTINLTVGGTATDTIDGEYPGTKLDDAIASVVGGAPTDKPGTTTYEPATLGKGTFYVSTKSDDTAPTVQLTFEDAGNGQYYIKSGDNYVYPNAEYYNYIIWRGWNYSLETSGSGVAVDVADTTNGSIVISRAVTGNGGTTAYLTLSGTTFGADGSSTSLYLYNQQTTPAGKETTLTFTGKSAGTTTVTIGNVEYTIIVSDKAPDNALTATSIDLEYWITNELVHETNDKATENVQKITTSKDGVTSAEGIAIADVAPETAYAFYDGTVIVHYWQAVRLDANHQQTDKSGVDQTAAGTTLTHIRYYSGAWQYKTTDGVWNYFESGDQLVAYYLKETEVTKEVKTSVKDWGYGTGDTTPDTSSGKGQVALTVAVVYPDGTVSPAEGDMYANSTTIFNYWNGRDIGIVAPTNNSDYNISKITVTDGKRKENTSANVWYTTDTITWDTKTNVAGKEWYDETEVWNKSSGTTPMVNGKASNITWSAKNTAKLVLIYLEPVEKETNLNVQYIDLNANNYVFHSYQVAMKYNQGDDKPTFTETLMLGNTVIGDKGPWTSNKPDNTNYLSDDAYVTNSSGTKQTFKKDITTIPEINGIYASGLYKYMKADISEDGKTLRLYYDLNATEGKTFVVDFGLPVEIPFSDFGITNVSDITVSFDEQNTAMMERQGTYGNGKIDMDAKTVTYTLIKTLDAKIPIPVYVADKNGNVQMLSVNVMPATSVYYEDSFAKFSPGTVNAANATWSIVGNDGKETADKSTSQNQTLTELSKMSPDDVYGHDDAYKNSTKLSMGSAHKVTVKSDMYVKGDTTTTWPSATFTFKGTGFDVISLTSNTSGSVVYTVTGKKTGYTETHLVDTYYGYKLVDNKWVVDENSNSTLYQIPVIKVTGLAYDEYTVTLSVRYGDFFDHQGKGEYSFWLDAIRVYDPMGVNNATYVDDGEGYPQYIMLRDQLAKVNDSVTTNGNLLFIDGAQQATIATYKVYGPNNEVYLANGQAITFIVPGNSNIESIQIGAKAPDGSNPAKMVVNENEAEAKVIQSATEMYYTIGTEGKQFTIANKGNGILSLTNLKITFKASGNTVTLSAPTAEQQTAAVMSVRALFAEPEQTFEPEYFTAKWSRNVRKGGTATLTVKASADVEAITVNGEKITAYTTKTARSVWGAKETYHVFTYRMTNAVAGDYTIYALNADGVASDPITAQLTVRPSIRDWWNGIFDKWKH